MEVGRGGGGWNLKRQCLWTKGELRARGSEGMPNPKSGVRRAETVFNQRNIMGKAGSGGKVQVSLDS